MAVPEPEVHPAIILGAGPAGLTAAYELVKGNLRPVVLEADPRYVGGISRTVEYKGCRFDIGGHRFFSKSAEIEQLWREILPNDFLERPRTSSIRYRGKFYSYPLNAGEALRNLGILEAIRCSLSYGWAQIFPKRNPRNFEEYVTNLFGKRLFSIFFKTYTEKVWGMSCREISADWAAQRIKGLSLIRAVLNSLGFKKGAGGETIKTLINTFRYPRLGPGMMWDACAESVQKRGGSIFMDARVTSLLFEKADQCWEVRYRNGDGVETSLRTRNVISSLPMRTLVQILQPAPPPQVLDAANSLRYRDFLIVAVMLRGECSWDDQWIYIHDPEVKVGRIQNFRAWSPELVSDPSMTCLGMEFFCFEGDGLWNASDADMSAQALRELQSLGLSEGMEVLDTCVIRQPKAYPVYDETYKSHVETIRVALERDYPGLHMAGRNGMHKYNNQDHSMMTGLLVARNILAGSKKADPWFVNEDAEYQEAGSSGLRDVPLPITKNE